MREPFALEKAYRQGFRASMVDLSTTSTAAPRVCDLIEDPESLQSLALAYEPGGGGQALRAAIAALYEGVQADDVLVTAGALEAIRAVAMALIVPGQAVLVQHPSYSALRQAVIDAGAVVTEWLPDAHLEFKVDDLVSTLDELPSIAFFNSPIGPSGAVVRDIASYPGFAVVDEVYRPIELVAGLRHRSAVEDSPKTVVIGDVSKPLGLGGLRIGWIVCRDATVLARCADALDYLSGSVSVVSAHLALSALRGFDDLLAPQLTNARENLMRLAVFVEQHRKQVDWTPPQGGFTAFLRLRCGRPPASLFENLRRRGIFLLDGDVFGYPDYLRVGLGLDACSFAAALDALGVELVGLPRIARPAGTGGDTIVFTKAPLPGLTKTRLAAAIGDAAATRLAGAFLRDTVTTAADHAHRLFIAVEPVGASLSVIECGQAEVFGQKPGDFGERLKSAFAEAFQRGAVRPVLIGSDSPTLPGHLLDVAHRVLETHDVVLGPTADGGYYAVGMQRLHPELFDGIDWSRPCVFAQTIERIETLKLRAFYLPVWYDVDVVEDLARLERDVLLSPATAEALARLGLEA